MIVYGARISYFTGKFETYLRYREIPYTSLALDSRLYRSVVPKRLGATQFPSVELEDGWHVQHQTAIQSSQSLGASAR